MHFADEEIQAAVVGTDKDDVKPRRVLSLLYVTTEPPYGPGNVMPCLVLSGFRIRAESVHRI